MKSIRNYIKPNQSLSNMNSFCASANLAVMKSGDSGLRNAFVCNDKYIVCTRSTVDGDKKQMHICITPVRQLLRKTR